MVSSNENDWIFLFDMDGALTGTTTPDKSGPGSNGNEGVLHIPQSFRIESSPSVVVRSHILDILIGVLSCRILQMKQTRLWLFIVSIRALIIWVFQGISKDTANMKDVINQTPWINPYYLINYMLKMHHIMGFSQEEMIKGFSFFV